MKLRKMAPAIEAPKIPMKHIFALTALLLAPLAALCVRLAQHCTGLFLHVEPRR